MAELFNDPTLWADDSGNAPAAEYNEATGQYYFTSADSLNYLPGSPIAPGDTITLSVDWNSITADDVIEIWYATSPSSWMSLYTVPSFDDHPAFIQVTIPDNIYAASDYPVYININQDNGERCQVSVAFGSTTPLRPWLAPPDPKLMSLFLFGPRRVIVSVNPPSYSYSGDGSSGPYILFDGMIGFNQSFATLPSPNAVDGMPVPTLSCDANGSLSFGWVDPDDPPYTGYDVISAYGTARIDVFMRAPASHVQIDGLVSDLASFSGEGVSPPNSPATFVADCTTQDVPDFSGYYDDNITVGAPPPAVEVDYDTADADTNPADDPYLQLPIQNTVGVTMNWVTGGGA